MMLWGVRGEREDEVSQTWGKNGLWLLKDQTWGSQFSTAPSLVKSLSPSELQGLQLGLERGHGRVLSRPSKMLLVTDSSKDPRFQGFLPRGPSESSPHPRASGTLVAARNYVHDGHSFLQTLRLCDLPQKNHSLLQGLPGGSVG